MSDKEKKAIEYIKKFFEDLPNMRGENGYGYPDSEDVVGYLQDALNILEGKE